jgi:predicted TIM-barrel fold metal-dependent hydrolase
MTAETTDTLTLAERAARLHIVDCDVHNELKGGRATLKPYLAREWHPFLDGGVGGAGRSFYPSGSPSIVDAIREEDGLAAGDPEWVIERLIDRYQIDVGILTGAAGGLSVQPNGRYATALASAINDWTLDRWVRPHACFKASIAVAPQEPEAAAREIERLGDDPGVVQVFMASATRIPYGQKYYWPIYRAAVEHGLPVAVHVGAEGVGIGARPTSAGYPSTYLEWHTDMSQTMMAQCVSLLTEGTFEEFPTLKFVFVEGGICWVPYVMWRLDRLYRAFKAELPYLRRMPSEYIRSNCRFTTQPIEEPPQSRHLLEMLEMAQAEHTLVFSSDYPHWDFDSPITALAPLPADLRRRICVDNALDLYGDRLLAPNA